MLVMRPVKVKTNSVSADSVSTEELMSLIRVEDVDIKPTCDCGNITDQRYLGSICDVCNTKVVDRTLEFESSVHMDMLNGRRWLKPHIVNIIGSALPMSTDNGVKVNLDPLLYLITGRKGSLSKTVVNKLSVIFDYLPDYEKGYFYFHDNIEMFLIAIRTVFNGAASEKIDFVIDYIRKDDAWTDKLYMPSRLLNETSKNSTRLVMSSALEAILEFRNLKNSMKEVKPSKISRIAGLILINFSEYTYGEHVSSHTGKGSITRRNRFSTATYYSFRETILPLEKPHKLTDIIIGYKNAMSLLRPYIISYLIKQHTLTESIDIYNRSINSFNKELHTYMMKLIEDSNEDGLPVGLLRNPTQTFTSIFKTYIVGIRDDLINAMSLSTNGHVGPNWDHDGDQMQGQLLVDEYMSMLYEPLKMYNSISTTSEPYGTSSVIGTVVGCEVIIDNWLKS